MMEPRRVYREKAYDRVLESPHVTANQGSDIVVTKEPVLASPLPKRAFRLLRKLAAMATSRQHCAEVQTPNPLVPPHPLSLQWRGTRRGGRGGKGG